MKHFFPKENKHLKKIVPQSQKIPFLGSSISMQDTKREKVNILKYYA